MWESMLRLLCMLGILYTPYIEAELGWWIVDDLKVCLLVVSHLTAAVARMQWLD